MFLRKTAVPLQAPPTAPSKSLSYKPAAGNSSTSHSHHHGGSNNNHSTTSTAHGAGQPVLGRMNPSNVHPGAKVWVSDPKVLWRIGEVQSVATDHPPQSVQVFVPDAPDEKLQTLSMSKLFAFDPSHIVDHDDVAQMNNMHEAPLLHVLRRRFEGDQIYTFTADILLSINPYKTIPLLYDVVGYMEQHGVSAKAKAGGASSVSVEDAAACKRPPHLFTIAEKAYTGMKGVVPGSGTPQSIIVSGESGAGKTEASKYIMKYLATASKLAAQQLESCPSHSPSKASATAAATAGASAASVHEKIEACVVLSNLILESFGNAKTSRNDNSSRFGKYIQIHYSAEGRMAGVSIRHFLLEKTRLVMPQASERNYHVFYQLLAGLPTLAPDTQSRLKLTHDVWNYVYLTRGDCVDVDGVDDAAEFEQLRKCMDQLGMDRTLFQVPLLELLAAILHLGNLQFESAQVNNDESTIPTFPEAARGVNLAHVASLLGVDPTEFAAKMVTQTTVTGRGSVLEMKLSADQAKNAMDAFCKYLYGELFHHLIGRINQYAKEQTSDAVATANAKGARAKAGAAGPTAAPFIGILDIFGFEVMQKNSLEQLCINFTNETLQQQFNRHVFVLEQERYANEGIQFSTVEYKDNQPCLELIQKPPHGLLPLLEEQMLLKRKTTDKQLLTIYHGNHLDRHAHYSKPRFECDEFVVRHYAGEVVYDVNEFIAKNTDNLHDDLLDLLKRSEQPLLQAIFAGAYVGADVPVKRSNSSAGAGTGASTPGKRNSSAALTGTTTVSSRFRTQLSELMDVLWHTSPNYIKCIKPNNLKFPGGLSCELVRDQLVYSGVLEVVRIRQEGFPIRKRFDVFYQLFWSLGVRAFAPKHVQTDPALLRDASEWIAREWLESKTSAGAATDAKRPFAMGRHEVFLRYGQVEKLEAFAAALRAEKALVVQALLLGWGARKKFQTVRRGVVKCQALWRMAIHKANYSELRSSALTVQTQWRRHCVHKQYMTMKRAASVLFSATLRFLTHRRFIRFAVHSNAAVRVQKHVRGYLMRTAAERQRRLQLRSAVSLQAWFKMSQQRRQFTRQRLAAVTLQAAHRSIVTRRHFLRRKQASIVLEAFVRQCTQRRKFRRLKQRVVKLQALVRQWGHRSAFTQLRRAVVVLQSKRRQRRAIQCRYERLKAVQTIQHALHGWRLRCHYLTVQRSVRVVQYVAKRWLQQKEYRELRAATRRIQSRWRTHHRTRAWRAEVASLFRSPCGSSGSSGGAKMEDSDRRVQRLRADPALYFHLRPQAFGFNTLFLHAAGCGDFHVVKFMLDATADKGALYDSRNARGHTAFHEACAHGQYEMAKFLLQYAKTAHEVPPAARPSDLSRSRKSKKTPEEPEQDGAPTPLGVGVLHQGFLKKRRETSRWMKRYVVLAVNALHQPQLEYYANDKPATLQAGSAKTLDLASALFKKSVDVPFAFEIHSPQLLKGRNKEGRLYFAAENELEIQKWLAHLRNVIPSSIESRLFAMHRGTKNGRIEFVDFEQRKRICSQPAASANRETPLHLVASASIGHAPVTPPGAAAAPVAHSSLEIAVSASAISVTVDDDHNNQRLSVMPSTLSTAEESASASASASITSPDPLAKSRVELEGDLVKTALWLIENGADMNAMTARRESPIKLALQYKNYLVAKYLLDRGALAHGLTETEVDDLQRIKAALTKNAISSVCGSSSGAAHRTSSAHRLGSFTMKRPSLATASSTSGNGPAPDALPLLFLQKQPGKVHNSSYVSVFVELLGISNPHYLSRPRIIVSVLDAQANLVEMKQQVSVQPLVLPAALLWAFTWHMQTPLENLPHGACVVVELTISPTLSSSSGTIAAAGAHDYVPVCWTYLQVDQRTANSMPLNTEMYKYPMDLSRKKLQRVDAFLNGDVFISQGPQ